MRAEGRRVTPWIHFPYQNLTELVIAYMLPSFNYGLRGKPDPSQWLCVEGELKREREIEFYYWRTEARLCGNTAGAAFLVS